MTASFGFAFFGEDGMTAEDLLVKVDERLYQAKREGRNLVVSGQDRSARPVVTGLPAP